MKTREIVEGISGSGHTVWIVVTEWTCEDGHQGIAGETFDTLAEAQAWIQWA